MTARRIAWPRGAVLALLLLALPGAAPGVRARAAEPAATAPTVSLTGKVKQPQHFDLDRLRALPSREVQAAYQTEHGPHQARFTGVLLWALLGEAGGIDDPERGAVLRHTVKITGRDGYFVVLSTGEIAPEFGDEPALIAYLRDGQPLGESGLRLVLPGDKRGGRNVRDVVGIDVQ